MWSLLWLFEFQKITNNIDFTVVFWMNIVHEGMVDRNFCLQADRAYGPPLGTAFGSLLSEIIFGWQKFSDAPSQIKHEIL
jgi:hypothetical protein